MTLFKAYTKVIKLKIINLSAKT